MHILKDQSRISEFLHHSLVMNKDNIEVTGKILNLTLEIIFLLTGEDFVLTKKPDDPAADSGNSYLSDGSSRCPSPVTEPQSLMPEVTTDRQSLGLNKDPHKIPVRCQDVAVYLSMAEWEYLKEHRERYKDVITENHQPPILAGSDSDNTERTTKEEEALSVNNPQDPVLDTVSHDASAADGCGSGSPSERCETPQDCIEEDNRMITQDYQAVSEDGISHPPCKEEAVPAEISPGGCGSGSPPERCETPLYSQDCIEEDNRVITQDYQAEPGDGISHPPCKEEDVPTEISSAETDTGGCGSGNPPGRCETPLYSQDCIEEENRMTTQDYQAEPGDGIFHPPCKEEAVPAEISSGLPGSWKVHPDPSPLILPVQVHHHNNGFPPNNTQVNNLSENSPKGGSRKPEIVLNKAPVLEGQIHFAGLFQPPSQGEHSSHRFVTYGTGNPSAQKTQENVHVVVYKCRQCGRNFSNKIDLLSHQRTHSAEKMHHCVECPQSFTDNAALVAHQWTFHRQSLVTEDRPFSCPECRRSFTKKSTLVKHQRIHTGAFACPDCGKCLSDKTGLILHRRTHTGEKPFACSECGRRFTQMCHLVTHQSVHTGERPFACSECGKCFSVRSVLVAHQAVHARHKTFACPECGKCFTQKAALATHRRIHAKDPGSAS